MSQIPCPSSRHLIENASHEQDDDLQSAAEWYNDLAAFQLIGNRMGNRKRRNDECDFQTDVRQGGGDKKGKSGTSGLNPTRLTRSRSQSTSSSSSSYPDDSVGHMNAVRGDVLVGRCKSNGCFFHDNLQTRGTFSGGHYFNLIIENRVIDNRLQDIHILESIVYGIWLSIF